MKKFVETLDVAFMIFSVAFTFVLTIINADILYQSLNKFLPNGKILPLQFKGYTLIFSAILVFSICASMYHLMRKKINPKSLFIYFLTCYLLIVNYQIIKLGFMSVFYEMTKFNNHLPMWLYSLNSGPTVTFIFLIILLCYSTALVFYRWQNDLEKLLDPT